MYTLIGVRNEHDVFKKFFSLLSLGSVRVCVFVWENNTFALLRYERCKTNDVSEMKWKRDETAHNRCPPPNGRVVPVFQQRREAGLHTFPHFAHHFLAVPRQRRRRTGVRFTQTKSFELVVGWRGSAANPDVEASLIPRAIGAVWLAAVIRYRRARLRQDRIRQKDNE